LYLSKGNIHEDFKDCIVSLYTSILAFQAYTFVHLSRSAVERGLRNTLKKDSWESWLNKIEECDEQCLKYTSLIDTEEERVQWEVQFGYMDKQTKVLEQISQEFKSLIDEQRRIRVEDDITKCLQSADHDRQKDTNPLRVLGTCQWFLDDKRFRDWRDSKTSSLLWVSADPGCGKSVLSRCLMDENHLATSIMTSTTTFFFFKDGQEGQTKASDALTAMLHQILALNPDMKLTNHAVPSWKIHGERLRGMFGELWSILLKIASDSSAGEVVCLIDALDECEEQSRAAFLESLINFFSNDTSAGSCTTRFKFLVTSRPYENINSWFYRLRDNSEYIHFNGGNESDKISNEIKLVIKAKVPEKVPLLPVEGQQKIIEFLSAKEHTTYLWLYLVFDFIEKKFSKYRSVQKLKKVLDQLPDSVNAAYATILEKSEDPPQASIFLKIVVAARRPLTIREMNIAATLATCGGDDRDDSYEALDLEPDGSFLWSLRSI